MQDGILSYALFNININNLTNQANLKNYLYGDNLAILIQGQENLKKIINIIKNLVGQNKIEMTIIIKN